MKTSVLPFREFKKISWQVNGAAKAVFEDNIRDYLDPNQMLIKI